MQHIDLTDIARGRRITAVAAAELERIPRKAIRPPRPGVWHRAKRRLTASLMRLIRRF